MAVVTLHESPEFRVGHVESLMVCVWTDMSSLASMDVMAAHEQVLIDTHGQVSLLLVFAGKPSGSAPGVKERGDQLARRFQPYVRANVVLVQSKGLAGILVRSFLAAFSLVSPIPMESATSLEDAARRLRQAPGQQPAVRDDARLFEKLQAFVEARPTTK